MADYQQVLSDADAMAAPLGIQRPANPLYFQAPPPPNALPAVDDYGRPLPDMTPAAPPSHYLFPNLAQAAMNGTLAPHSDVPTFTDHLLALHGNVEPAASPFGPQSEATKDFLAGVRSRIDANKPENPPPPPSKEDVAKFLADTKAKAAQAAIDNPPKPPMSKAEVDKFVADTRARAAAAKAAMTPPPNPFDPKVPKPGLLETNVPGYNPTPVQPEGNMLLPFIPTASNATDWLTGPPGSPQANGDPAYVRRFEGTRPLPGVRYATPAEQRNLLLNNAPWLANLAHMLVGNQ